MRFALVLVVLVAQALIRVLLGAVETELPLNLFFTPLVVVVVVLQVTTKLVPLVVQVVVLVLIQLNLLVLAALGKVLLVLLLPTKVQVVAEPVLPRQTETALMVFHLI
jgi:hypothetical protein